MIHFSPRLWGLDMNYKEQIEWLRGFEIDHSPDGWPAIRMREISAMCDAVESLLAENERLNAELAKYRDAPVVAVKLTWGGLELKDVYSTLPKGTQLIIKPGELK